MGIDIHGFNFLRYAAVHGPFGDVITAGRQGFHVLESHVRDKDTKRLIRSLGDGTPPRYCDQVLITCFGASTVDSIDKSDYEGATILHDLNEPLPARYAGRYDTVVDAGTLEHVFSINVALDNMTALCRPGGQVIHVLPANNFCGHGFWQFSPEVFFGLYAEENGYADTEVFLSDVRDERHWYRVERPAYGRRVTVHSCTRVQALVRTRIVAPVRGNPVQQGDYSAKWCRGGAGPGVADAPDGGGRLRALLRQLKRSRVFMGLYRSYYRTRPSPTMRLDKWNPNLTRLRVSPLLSRE